MSQLSTSSQGWKVRVTESDANLFTVSHKLAQTAAVKGTTTTSTASPPLSAGEGSSPPAEKRVPRTPQPKVFKSKTGTNIPNTLAPPKTEYRRTVSQPSENGEEEETAKKVEVFSVADEEFNNFFVSSCTEIRTEDRSLLSAHVGEVLDLQALDLVTSTAQPLPVIRRHVKRMARHRVSGNPLKTASALEQAHYTQTRLHAGEKHLRDNKVKEISKNSTFAMEALAGLASKENFSSVTLKPVTTEDIRELPPYTHPMLIRVKGRRHAEARLMQPSCHSVNTGDDFVLVTPDKVYHYKGEFANVIERAKAAEIASFIVQQKDLGVTSSAPVVEISENIKGIRRTRFWKILGGDGDTECEGPHTGGDDEEMETCLAKTNKIYRVVGSSLVPHEEAWGRPPTVDILSDEEVLVFDFGSEVYSWSGKKASPSLRKAALLLAKELWETPYDYSDCDVNPVYAVVDNADMTGSRPSWGVLGKVTQNLETVLFKEKFIDWPDTAQQAKIKEVKEEMSRKVDPVSSLQPCSGAALLFTTPPEPDMVLEMTHLGRGTQYYDAQERRLLTVHTKEFKVWHASEAGVSLLGAAVRSHFHASDTYVVRWYYSITASGRTLKGAPSKHAVTGRERVAYFFWQGRHSSLSDKGACALLTVELDEERGPHVRVSMGSEPPAFLNMFSGSFVVHEGNRADNSCSPWRLYLVRGEVESEGHLVAVPVQRSHLRSRGCLLLVNTESACIHVWNGCKALKHSRKVASHVSKCLAQNTSMPWGSAPPSMKEQFEGAETKDFWEDMIAGEKNNSSHPPVGAPKEYSHLSLLSNSETSYDWSPRMWRLEAKHDRFEALEVTCSYHLSGVANPMPFMQEQIYNVPQPALFLIEGGGKIYLWQGWWPQEDASDSLLAEDVGTTGSAVLRFNFARKAALQTALNCAECIKRQTDPEVIIAGFEPLEFTNLFPIWTPRPEVHGMQIKGGRYTVPQAYLVKNVLAELSRSHYSLAELQTSPPPDGVDPSRMEDYLTDKDFEETLCTTRQKFEELPQWKQLQLKKQAQLF